MPSKLLVLIFTNTTGGATVTPYSFLYNSTDEATNIIEMKEKTKTGFGSLSWSLNLKSSTKIVKKIVTSRDTVGTMTNQLQV